MSMPVSAEITACLTKAVTDSLSEMCGDAPDVKHDATPDGKEGLVGTMDFAGEAAFGFRLALPEDTATGLVRSFLGTAVPYDGEMMEDAVREVVNVIAGEIVASLGAQGHEATMGLPGVARGPIEGAKDDSSQVWVGFASADGEFWMALTGRERDGA